MRKPLVHSMVNKPMRFMLVAMLMGFGASAWSDCACFCVEGELTTMCTDASQAQDSPNLCPPSSSASCPQSFSTDGASSYEAPNEHAENCRDVKVYDAVRGEYVTAKACNVI